MKIEEGVFVRHVTKPEWGIGKIEGINGENVFVRFPSQLKTLKMSFAERLLEPASAGDLADRTVSRAGPAVGRTTACDACGKTLDKSRRSADGMWKACVRCSLNDGTEHILYPYPDAFAESPSPLREDDTTGHQNDCAWCRSGRTAAPGTARRCGDTGTH